MKKIAKNNHSSYFEWSEGIIYSEMDQAQKITTEEVAEAMNTLKGLKLPGKKLLIMSDITKIQGMSKEARKFSEKDPEFNAMVGATALITGSAISKMIGNFLIGLNKGIFPIKIFTNKEKAADWLRTHEN